MRYIAYKLGAVVFLLFSSMQGFGGELRLSVTFSKEALSFSKFMDYDIVTLAGHGVTSDIGKPMLPQVTSLAVIPPSATVTKVMVIYILFSL
ncbi:hypothetical protein KAX35_06660 [candidate division WOR-3 bacterium]|nr:hypothetical protein [candidate division WOR-3 bacterium]